MDGKLWFRFPSVFPKLPSNVSIALAEGRVKWQTDSSFSIVFENVSLVIS